VVNAHILHSKTSKKKMSLKIFYEKVAEGLLASARTEMHVQGQTSSPADLLGETVFYIGFQRHTKMEETTQRSCAEKSKRQTGKTIKNCTTENVM
jgi:hypothetical protein